MGYREEDYLMLSGIQHFSFCRRQWALIHIEQQWDENLRTVEGNLFHKKAHDGYSSEKRKDIIVSRGMPVFSRELGVSGTLAHGQPPGGHPRLCLADEPPRTIRHARRTSCTLRTNPPA